MTEQQSRRDWEPKPGDPVAIIGGGWESTVTMAEVLRLTKTQIVVKATGYAGASEARFRRAEPWILGRDDYPRYRQIGGSTGRWSRLRTLTHPESQDVLNIRAEDARRARLGLTLGRLDEFRAQRDVDAAQRAVEALQDFIQHEEDASKG